MSILKKQSSGFTFIEMLVVSVLIVVLSMIVMVTFTAASKKTRDARRKKDVMNTQVALESFRQSNAIYPDALSELVPDQIESVPHDPKQASGWTDYSYTKSTDLTYQLVTYLENTNDDDANGTAYGLASNAYVVVQPN